MAGNQNNQKPGGGGFPIYVGIPGPLVSGKQMVEKRPDGSFDVTLEVRLNNPNDNTRYVVVRYVNGQMVPGTIEVHKQMREYTFEKVKPAKSGEVELVLCLAKNLDVDSGTKPVVLSKKYFAPTISTTITEAKKSIQITAGFPDLNGITSVSLQLFDDSGIAITGKVKITAMQQFELDGNSCSGLGQIDVNDVNGVITQIKASSDELFQFTDLRTRHVVGQIIIGV